MSGQDDGPQSSVITSVIMRNGVYVIEALNLNFAHFILPETPILRMVTSHFAVQALCLGWQAGVRRL